MNSERRPRISADLAERIDNERGEIPFERYVRNLLTESLGLITTRPEGKKYVVVRSSDGEVISEPVGRRKAEEAARLLSLAVRSHNVAYELMADTIEEEDDLYELAYGCVQGLHELGDKIAGRYGIDLTEETP